MTGAATESLAPTERSLLVPNASAPTNAETEILEAPSISSSARSSLLYHRIFAAGFILLLLTFGGYAVSQNWQSLFEGNRAADINLLGLPHPWPCNEIMVGVWTKTCLVQTQGMISYNLVSLWDGSFAELQSDGLGFMSMYGTYAYTPGQGASSSQNCLVDYTAHVKQEPLDTWRPTQGSLDYNTWYFGKDYFTNEPNAVSCRFERIKGQECRNRISRLLFHFANDGVSLSQYQNAPDELC